MDDVKRTCIFLGSVGAREHHLASNMIQAWRLYEGLSLRVCVCGRFFLLGFELAGAFYIGFTLVVFFTCREVFVFFSSWSYHC